MKEYEKILNDLAESGYRGYLVGGCVRDILLQKTPSDYDIATNATPDQVKKVFSFEKIIDTGIKHGTVTLILNGQAFEITTFRGESKYSDGRHPDSVCFCDTIEEDLSRRDFTINAMALDLHGQIIDLYSGRKDLEKGIIRCVGDAKIRFSEDALRILRALRFSSVLGFEIEKDTAKAAFELKDRLLLISKERCYAELQKILCGKNAGEVVEKYISILSVLLPECKNMEHFDQNNPHHCHDLLKHTCIALDSIPPEVSLRFAALLHDVGKSFVMTKDEVGISHYYGHAAKSKEIAEKLLISLRADRATLDEVLFLISHHDAPPEKSKQEVAKKIRKYGIDRYRNLILLRRADNMAQGEEYHRKDLHDFTERMANELMEEGNCLSLQSLAINGNDLIKIGYSQNKYLGNTLEYLLNKVIEGEIPNSKEALLSLAHTLLPDKQ